MRLAYRQRSVGTLVSREVPLKPAVVAAAAANAVARTAAAADAADDDDAAPAASTSFFGRDLWRSGDSSPTGAPWQQQRHLSMIHARRALTMPLCALYSTAGLPTRVT